jgi:hypothetical protein
MGVSFEDHYKRVIDNTANQLITNKRAKFNRVTVPESAPNKEGKKGFYMFDQNDVMSLPILNLNEDTIKEMYGEKRL